MQLRRDTLRLLRILVMVLMLVPASAAIANPSLALAGQETSDTLPLARPKWTRPTDADMVFYIQRSMNPNTVVYTAQFDDAGALTHEPLKAYWRRYAESGQTRSLKMFERLLAYGVKARKNSDAQSWNVTFAALSDVPVEMRQNEPNQATLWARINNRDYKMIYGFLDLDQSGLITKVTRLRLYTFEPVANKYVTHLISVSGGDITE